MEARADSTRAAGIPIRLETRNCLRTAASGYDLNVAHVLTSDIDFYSFIDEYISVYEIRHFLTADGKDVYSEWHRKLRNAQAKIAIDRRINRIELGNFGDHKFCRDGVWELRFDLGQGYRVYYALAGSRIILLLGGGDKQSQNADIDRACECWLDWQRRTPR